MAKSKFVLNKAVIVAVNKELHIFKLQRWIVQTFILHPYCHESEQKCTTYSTKEAPPIITHRKIGCRYLDAKQHP